MQGGAWARLRAATTAAATFMRRRAGFRAGDPADFVALGADPLGAAAALRELPLIVREGRVVTAARSSPT